MNQIVERLWVGDLDDALRTPAGWVNINVAYEHLQRLPKAIYLPFMLPVGIAGLVINSFLLNLAADMIDENLSSGKTVLVNCNMGQERSPLAVVWYLYRKKGLSIDEAYKLVASKRPQIWDRRAWLESLVPREEFVR